MTIVGGNKNAIYNYANMFQYGDGIPADKSKAIEYYLMEIRRVHSDSINNYVLMLIEKKQLNIWRWQLEKGNSNAMCNYAQL